MTYLGNKDRINRYLDGEMSPSEQTSFEEHLTGCRACQRELARTRALFAALHGLQEVPVPASFTEEVLAGLPRRSASPLGGWVLVAEVAATAIFLALAYPILTAWYGRIGAWFTPGWLSNRFADLAAWGRQLWRWLDAALAIDVGLAWPMGFGLTRPQTAVMALALVGLWWLGNRLLLAAKSNGAGGTT